MADASGSSFASVAVWVCSPVGVPSLDRGWATSIVGASSVSGIPSFCKESNINTFGIHYDSRLGYQNDIQKKLVLIAYHSCEIVCLFISQEP